MKKKVVFLIVTLGLVAGAYTGYKYLYKDHRNIANETSIRVVNASELQRLFQNNETENLLNQTVTVEGEITQIEANTLTLNDKVQCSFTNGVEGLTVGDVVSVKGRCIGYDDLFEIVKMDQSTITQP